MQGHTGERPPQLHECPYDDCGKRFSSPSKLEIHSNTHAGKKFDCTFKDCGKQFSNPSNLKVHVDTHSDKVFVCTSTGCVKRFPSQRKLNDHAKTHAPKKCKCQVVGCGKRFLHPCQLKVHTDAHAGKKLKCDVAGCDREFSARKSLKEHEKKHLKPGVRRFKTGEDRLAKELTAAKIDFEREVTISYSCIGGTNARLDFDIAKGTHEVLLERDQRQHKDESIHCEVSRMVDKVPAAIRATGNDRPLLWLRFNPDSYTVDGRKKRTPMVERYKCLADIISNYVPSAPLEICYLYYDTVNGVHVVTTDPDYPESAKALIKNCVV